MLFPNAIILALSPEVEFKQSPGRVPDGLTDIASMGTLRIAVREEGHRVAWIVDGQQRALALSKCENNQLPVPVVAFVSDDLQMQREQFILVNKAKPLPIRLIDELLPETGVLLPRDLAARKIPSELCNYLSRDPYSPFHGLIRRVSESDNKQAVITDTALAKVIKNSINSPLGVLAPFKGTKTESADLASMYTTMRLFWAAVRDTFPEAWGLPPGKSRLMHSAGIEAMGTLMDRIMARAAGASDADAYVRQALQSIAPGCRWCSGTWESIDMKWSEIQTVPRHIRELKEALIRLDFEASQNAA